MQRNISVNLGNLFLSLSEITDLANPSIAQHQQRTAFIALEIAKVSGVQDKIIEDIFAAALLHDIGAISVEEKVAIRNFDLKDTDHHCIRGEVLLNKTPWLKDISNIIRNHHRSWEEWDQPIDTPFVLASQIVLLSDYVERLIDRNKYILYQDQEIINKIKSLVDKTIHPRVVEYFLSISGKEEFWLDLVSHRLYPLLLHDGPYRNANIDLDGIYLIAELFRDIIDFKSRFTATHSSGVAACAEVVSRLFGLTDMETQLMKVAGNLHDIGKMIVPNSILEKPDKLTKEEFAIMRCHTYYTYYVINTIGGLQQIAEWAAYHHEKLDGSGYPFHCKAREISTGSRIMCVADIFTAIAEDRPYRKGMAKDEIYRIIKGLSSKQYLDSRIVGLLFDNYDQIISYVKEKQDSAKEFYESQFEFLGKKT